MRFLSQEIERKALFDPQLVLFLENPISRDALILQMTEQLVNHKKISSASTFYGAVLEREGLISTGIGHGIAIPHAKLSDLEDFFVAIAILKEKGIDWGSIDGSEVRIVFLIGGPVDRQADYLHVLSQITQIVQQEEVREKLLLCQTNEELINLLK